MVRIGVVYSGISYQQISLASEPCLKELSVIPIYNLPEIDLSSYDALIFPRGTDQEILFLIRHKIKEFLDSKGIIVAEGEISTNWLPSCNWQPPIKQDNESLLIKSDHPILKGLKADDLHWHKGLTEWCSHGHFSAPPNSEIIVANQKGDAILYIDKRTTNGIIVGISNLDAFCHSFHGIEAAKIFLRNLISWVEEQAVEIRKTKGNNLPRVAALYSGLKFQYDIFTSRRLGYSIELVHAFRLSEVNISTFDVLIVPRESNQEVLLQKKDGILEFLNHGKTLISFGEITQPWLPSCKWENRKVDVKSLKILNPNHSLMKGITIENIQWHAHGVFHAPPQAEVIVKEANGGDIIYIDSNSYDGKIMATTLDPEVHAGYGTGKTLKFLKSVLIWAIEGVGTGVDK